MHFTAFAQGRISGIIKDASNGERLIGATVYSADKGTVTDLNGFFTLSLNKGDSITFSYVGYSPEKIYVSGLADTLVGINLMAGKLLGQVEVRTSRLPESNISTLSPMELQSLPSLSGKPDVMRAMQLLPGIMTQSEGSNLLLVRGGNPGENMYLLDNVPLIYVNHLGGFMSVFNADIINNLDLY
ncbi:MAG: TonB-dependent receptor, partial [Bacteroidales bacterium]|nr:TonB-dependent receptor [Bacteroidales bacterium]